MLLSQVTTVGYVWVSTVDHSLDIQLDAFNAAGLAVLAVAPPVRTMRP